MLSVMDEERWTAYQFFEEFRKRLAEEVAFTPNPFRIGELRSGRGWKIDLYTVRDNSSYAKLIEDCLGRMVADTTVPMQPNWQVYLDGPPVLDRGCWPMDGPPPYRWRIKIIRLEHVKSPSS